MERLYSLFRVPSHKSSPASAYLTAILTANEHNEFTSDGGRHPLTVFFDVYVVEAIMGSGRLDIKRTKEEFLGEAAFF